MFIVEFLKIMNAIDNGFVDTCDLFEDFVTYVSHFISIMKT